jgi:hypothetical protein
MKTHRFDIPYDYKYAKLKLDLINDNPKNAERLGDKISVIASSPDGPSLSAFFGLSFIRSSFSFAYL